MMATDDDLRQDGLRQAVPRQDGLRQAVGRRGSFLRTLKAVGWSFFGVRKSADLAHDMAQLNPLHIVVAAVLAAAAFIGVLIALVQWVVAT